LRGIRQRLGCFRDFVTEVGLGIYHLPGLHGVLRTIGRTLRGFLRDDCHVMAAAISFYAMLSLIPFVMLLLSVAGYVLEHLSQDYASEQALFEHLEVYIRAVIPFASEDFFSKLRGIVVNRGAYGLTGMGVLILTAGLVFRTLELAFSRIFKTQRRSAVNYQLVFMAFVLAVGLLFLGAHYFSVIGSSIFSARSEGFAQVFDQAMGEYFVLRFLVTLFTGSIVFVVLLKYFSRERVRTRASLLGGLLFALLWMVAAKVFGYYLTHVARFSLLYGSLATLAVIVVWIFYSSLILLLCTEFARELQDRFWPLGSGPVDAAPMDEKTELVNPERSSPGEG